MTYSRYLKKSRVFNGLSQKELADKIGVSRQSISKWERGINYPDIEHIILLSQLYDVSIEDLLGIKDKA